MNNEQKTPIEWFQQLKEPYRSEAIALNNITKPCESLQSAISGINWERSPQGYEYWKDIYNSIAADVTEYLDINEKQKEIIKSIYSIAFNSKKTETELKPQDMISGEWYVLKTNIFEFILKFNKIEDDYLYDFKCVRLDDKEKYQDSNYLCDLDKIKSIRKATREEVLEHFPDEFKDEKKEVETEEKYFYFDGLSWWIDSDLEKCTELAESGSTIYKATPIGTKVTKSILEPIKTK